MTSAKATVIIDLYEYTLEKERAEWIEGAEYWRLPTELLIPVIQNLKWIENRISIQEKFEKELEAYV